MSQRSCAVCGSTELPRGAHRYCSKQCRLIAKRPPRKTDPATLGAKKCTECGDEIYVTQHRPKKMVCSNECRLRRKRRLQLGRIGSTWPVDGLPRECAVCASTFTAVSTKNVYCSENCKRINDDRRRAKSAATSAGLVRKCRKCGVLVSSRRMVCDDCRVDKSKKKERYRRYGMTADDYESLRSQQDHRCALCGRHEDELNGKLFVDHCHNQGWVRGLLCQPCNSGLGMFRDSCELLDKAKKYLTSPPTNYRHEQDRPFVEQMIMFAPAEATERGAA